MKFTLVYDGPLPSNGAGKIVQKKSAIRATFHPQMQRLWERQDLQWLKNGSIVRRDGRYTMLYPHHLHPEAAWPIRPEDTDVEPTPDELDLCAPLVKAGRQFFPLVRKTLGLTCGLRILFLRGEPRGKVLQSGDLDNRIKVLIDALSIPTSDERYDTASPDPIYCLLEDDSLVTALEVRAEQLLAPRDQSQDEKEVRLVIEVDVRVSYPAQYNLIFGGD